MFQTTVNKEGSVIHWSQMGFFVAMETLLTINTIVTRELFEKRNEGLRFVGSTSSTCTSHVATYILHAYQLLSNIRNYFSSL